MGKKERKSKNKKNGAVAGDDALIIGNWAVMMRVFGAWMYLTMQLLVENNVKWQHWQPKRKKKTMTIHRLRFCEIMSIRRNDLIWKYWMRLNAYHWHESLIKKRSCN